jgi:hypothetical protein
MRKFAERPRIEINPLLAIVRPRLSRTFIAVARNSAAVKTTLALFYRLWTRGRRLPLAPGKTGLVTGLRHSAGGSARRYAPHARLFLNFGRVTAAKKPSLHLHLMSRELKLPGHNMPARGSTAQEVLMTKKVFLVAVTVLLVAAMSGCSTCRTGGWFTRGDKCCPPPACPPGMPQATMMMPGSPQVLPGGPIEVIPSM